MGTQVIVTFMFDIPKSEIADIDEKKLKEWVLMQVGASPEMEAHGQFDRYELSDFSPVVKELWRNTKRLI